MAQADSKDLEARSADGPGGRVLYFEWARCLAAAAVVLIHVTSGIMDNYTVAEVGTARALVWSEMQVALMRWAVPVFLMITGALLLDPGKKAGWEKVGGYVKRMALVLCTFGLAFCLMKEYFAYRALSLEMLGQSVLDLLSDDGFSHMWYVYALIGIYLLLPVFKAFVAAAGKRELEVLLAILFAFTCVVPTVNSAFGTSISTFVWLTSSAFYVFLGYYAHNYMELSREIVVIGLVALVACMGFKAYGIVVLDEYCKFLHGPACFMEALWSLLVFLLMKSFLDRPYAEEGVVAVLSNLSFGIYIVHPLFINALYKAFGCGPWTMPPVVFELSVWAIAFFGSTLLVIALKKTPFFRAFL